MINLIFLISLFSIIISQTPPPDQPTAYDAIRNPALYKNEICSYNGRPIIIGFDKVKVKCECYESYVNEPNKKNYKYIGDQLVQCSYQKKRRFKTFFLAGILPMGLDFLYLGYTLYFVIIFIAFVAVIVNNFVHFYLSYQLDEKREENKYKDNGKSSENNPRNFNMWYRSKNKMDEKDKNIRCLKIYNIINKISLIVFLIYWIVDIILQAKGIIKDSNGVETNNDMNTLFTREDI